MEEISSMVGDLNKQPPLSEDDKLRKNFWMFQALKLGYRSDRKGLTQEEQALLNNPILKKMHESLKGGCATETSEETLEHYYQKHAQLRLALAFGLIKRELTMEEEITLADPVLQEIYRNKRIADGMPV